MGEITEITTGASLFIRSLAASMNSFFNMHITIAIVSGFFILFSVLESLLPLRTSKYPRVKHLLLNAFISVVTYAVAFALVKPAGNAALAWTSQSSIGLLHVFKVEGIAEVVFGFLILDLSFYYWHRANHKIPLLWRMHNVHHCDQDLDVSTAFRFHPVEVAISVVFRVGQILISGVTPATFALYEVVFQVGTFFHHSNINLPLKAEKLLNNFFVTPRMHAIHHSAIKDETDSNYSVLFSFWDRLHKTLYLNVRQSDITIGVPGYSGGETTHVLKLLFMPFTKQRPYWRAQNRDYLTRDKKSHPNG